MSDIASHPAARFWEKVEEADDGCLIWTGARNGDGYGRFGVAGRNCHAHRVAYEMEVGPIPAGLVIDHACRNRACVNPDHLRAVTQRENIHAPGSEAVAARKAAQGECHQGHRFTPENTYIRPDGRGRECRACHRSRQRKRTR